jgi:hypothetical protein
MGVLAVQGRETKGIKMAPFLGPKLKEAKGGLSQEWRRREPLRESEQQIERFRKRVKVIACQRPLLLFLYKALPQPKRQPCGNCGHGMFK